MVWPIVLIAIGTVFLLNNIGVLGWDVWEFLGRMWPLLIIAIGLDILIGRRSAVGSLLIGLVLVAVLAGGYAAWEWGSWGGEVTTQQISQQLGSAERANVNIEFGTGRFQLNAMTDSPDLINGQIQTFSGENLSKDAHNEGSTLFYTLKSEGSWTIMPFFGRNSDKLWDLHLNSRVPTDLKLSGGVGTSNLDLTNLKLNSLELHGGVGQVKVTLPAHGQMRATINGGVGQVDITLPAGMAARISANGGLGGINVSGSYNRDGNTYTSTNYSGAADRVDLEVQGGVGQVNVR